MKTVLITGASSGIGKATALHFANNGWQVIATMIALDESHSIKEVPNISCYELDVTCTESIEKAKRAILETFPKIDVLINNAGVGYRSFVELSDDQNLERIVSINWLGVVKMARAFIPIFREQGCGQIINISSIAGLVNLPLGSFYHSTKQAVESFSECMAYELLDFNISVATVQFGNAPTNFQNNAAKSDVSSIASYNRLMEKITQTLQEKSAKNKNLTRKITHKLLEIAENPQQSFRRYSIGFDAQAMKILRARLGYRLFNRIIRKFIAS